MNLDYSFGTREVWGNGESLNEATAFATSQASDEEAYYRLFARLDVLGSLLPHGRPHGSRSGRLVGTGR